MTFLRIAELVRYACNAFHAVKIDFANGLGALAGALGIDGGEVMAALARDTKSNATAAYLRPEFVFGGSCLPKDLRALNYRARRLDLKLPLLESVLRRNDADVERAVQRNLKLPAGKIGLYGLTYKEYREDLREPSDHFTGATVG